MNKLKQNLLKLKYHKLRTILLVLLFMVLFSALLIFMVLYENSTEHFRHMTRYTINQLTLSGRGTSIGYYVLDELEEDPAVYDYNVLDNSGLGERFVDIQPIIQDTAVYEDYLIERKKRMEERRLKITPPEEGALYGVKESKSCVYFLTQGYKLIEGRHIKETDRDKNSVLISEELAEKNGLQIGDTFSLEPSQRYDFPVEDSYELKIVGIFKAPVEGKYVTPRDDPRNFMIMHYEAFGNDFYHKTKGTAAPGVKGVNIFLEDKEDAQQFIDKFNEFHISMFGGYYFYNNEEWTEIVSAPLREMQNFSKVLMMIFLVGIGIILLILSAFLIEKEKREIRLLFAVGEKRENIVRTILVGQVLPVWLGGLIAVGIAAGVSGAAGDYLSESYYKNSQAFADELIADNVELYDEGEVYMSAPERMTMNVDQRVKFEMEPKTVLIYLVVLFLGVPALIYIQCKVRIRRI